MIAYLSTSACTNNTEKILSSEHKALSRPDSLENPLFRTGHKEIRPIDTWPAVDSAIQRDERIEAKIDHLLKRMTLEEKVGQIIQVELRQATPEDVRKFHIGSILNGGGSFPNGDKYATALDWVATADAYYKASVDNSDGGVAIPIIWGTDAVHGNNNLIGATLFPHNIGLGATRNPSLLKRIGRATAAEVAATGIDWVFSPSVATVRNDLWGRSYEGYSEDPKLVKKYAGMMIAGLQGIGSTPQQLDSSHVIATAKHFIGDGGTTRGIDRGDNPVSEQDLFNIHGRGFEAALAAGVQTVMASFHSWKNEPMHGNYYLLTQVLKERMGFDGFVVGDWNGHSYLKDCTSASCPTAINAGIDLLMAPKPDWKTLYKNTLRQVKRDIIPKWRLDDAVRRILRVKLRAKLFDAAPSDRPMTKNPFIIGSPDHRRLARQAVRESLVLLKNKNNLLPLERNLHVMVCGDGADNIGKQSGGWTLSWQGSGNSNADFPGATSIFSGIQSVVDGSGGKTIHSDNCDYNSRPDVAIVVYGENPYAEGQGDLKTLEFQRGSHHDLARLKKLKANDIPVISIFLSGRPLWVNAELNASDAFIAAWLPGSEGQGIADLIFLTNDGDMAYDFTGKLSFSWPQSVSQTSLNIGNAHYQPLFPYGFGLSYRDQDTLGDDLSEIVNRDLAENSANTPQQKAVLPLTFENSSVVYPISSFDGGAATVVNNPYPIEINTSNAVGKFQKFAGQAWGGSTISLEGTENLSGSTTLTLKVWSSRPVSILAKLEGANIETTAAHNGAGAWEKITFDYGDASDSSANAITLIFDNGMMGDAANHASEWTFFVDEINLVHAGE